MEFEHIWQDIELDLKALALKYKTHEGSVHEWKPKAKEILQRFDDGSLSTESFVQVNNAIKNYLKTLFSDYLIRHYMILKKRKRACND
jgi:hypothetical protein